MLFMLLLQVDPALVVDINFIKPNHDKPIDLTISTPTVSRTHVVQQHDVNADSLYQALYQILPGACIFTSVPLPELESGPATATLSTEPNPPDQSLTVAATRNEPDLVNSDVPIIAAQSLDTEVTNTGNEVETDENQAESSCSEPNQSCIVTITDTISAVCTTLTPETVESEIASVTTDAEILTEDVNQTVDVIPAPLTSLYHERYQQMSDHQLKKEAERVFYGMKISDGEAVAIEKATVAQHSSVQWRDQRNGCITASLFHDVYVRKESTDPECLIKRIMGYEHNDLSHVPAIKWGVQNECVARQQYTDLMSAQHEGFACSLTGLWINPLYAHMGVSPDGCTTCNCCGEGLLEIKCPFSAKDDTSINCKTCKFLTGTDYLNRKHRYYTQVQGQLLVTGKSFCDFFIWTPSSHKLEQMYTCGRNWKKTDLVFCYLCASRDFDWQNKAICRK